MKVRLFAALFALLLVGLAHAEDSTQPRPNILVVMVDDMGFADLGCFGSEIQTPRLDKLAEQGLRFTQFYNTAKCHSSRVSLLTGMYANQAGQEKMNAGPTVAEVLQTAGYFTAMTGKWHLQQEPTDRGFDRYWGHLSGATNFFTGDKTFRLNGERWQVPEKDFYVTTANADFAKRFIDEAARTDRPLFLYMAFNAPHYPLHCLEEDYRLYEDTYRVGWDAIRAQRQARQRALGLFGDNHPVPAPRPEHVAPWDSLTDDEKEWESQRMAAYAAMIHRVDIELGRVLDHLDDKGMLQNTLVLFVSDNGACPFDRTGIRGGKGIEARPWDPASYWCYSPGWAHVCNVPFRLYKQNQHEGGISSPAIAYWPAGLEAEPGSITDQPAHLIDVMPTLKQLARIPEPTEPAPTAERTLFGRSLVPLLQGEAWVDPRELYFRFGNNRAVRRGDWKLVSFRHSPWELYNLAEDRTELNDLSDAQPERVEAMKGLWYDWAETVNRMSPAQRQPVKDRMQKANF